MIFPISGLQRRDIDMAQDIPTCANCDAILPDNPHEHYCKIDLTEKLKSAILELVGEEDNEG